jgi:hypothetical protein
MTFGEKVKGYNINVFNEREVRAAAGILFLFAFIAFTNAFLLKNYAILKIFISGFLIDFVIRVLINPKYAPTLILSRLIVSNQKPEYSGAPQKRFAWALGLGLASIMFVVSVLLNITGPLNLTLCIICLTLLFFEASFGICIGCKMYNLFNKEKAKLCPGGVCELKVKEEIQKTNLLQIIILAIFIITIVFISIF